MRLYLHNRWKYIFPFARVKKGVDKIISKQVKLGKLYGESARSNNSLDAEYEKCGAIHERLLN